MTYCENVGKSREEYSYFGPQAEPMYEEDIVDRVMDKYEV